MTNSLGTRTMPGRASSTRHRPHMGRPWQRFSTASVTSPSKMQMPLWCTLAFMPLHTSVRSTKTTGRTLFAQWQKRHPNRDGTECAMVLPLPQQDLISCAAWACRHYLWLQWPATFFNIKCLHPRHFEAIRAQMEREEEGKVTVKIIPDLTDVPKWKDRGSMSMSKHFRDFETYLSQHYGVEGFPLYWVV